MVQYSAKARADLQAIRAYITGQANTDRAVTEIMKIVAACELLDSSQRIGRIIRNGRREHTTTPYVIVYRITPAGPRILRVWHGRQQRPS